MDNKVVIYLPQSFLAKVGIKDCEKIEKKLEKLYQIRYIEDNLFFESIPDFERGIALNKKFLELDKQIEQTYELLRQD